MATNVTGNLTNGSQCIDLGPIKKEPFGGMIKWIALTEAVGIIILNTLLILLLARRKKPSRMAFFVQHLAIADLSVGVLYVLPDTIFSRFLNSWQKHFCLFFYGFCANITIFASTFLIVVLTIDRLFVIIRPISASMIGKKYRYGLVSCAWLLAIIIGIPYAAHAYFSCTVQGINICGHDFDNTKAVVVAEVFINVVIPVIIISFCYTWIVYVIKRREKAGFNAPQKVRFSDGSTTLIGNFKKTESSSSSVITKAKKKTIKILLVVVIVYIVSWTPINVAQVLSAFEFIPPNEIFLFLHVLAPVNSIMNPLVFLIFNRQMFVQDRSRSTSTAYNTATHIESVHH
ncbi:cardioacceleratory peptide receptor-like [Mytilus edulis]|uniref:cardioacceleratory peptide receptor-like n=1 Tax=Mytilus edulis TaxID=6550 RepID=UPI0039F09428